MKRGGNLKRTPLARRTPLRNTPLERSSAPLRASKPQSSPPVPRERKPASTGGRTRRDWQAAKGVRCALCPSRQGLHLHHVIYAQHVQREGGDIYDPRNGMTLCFKHHFEHHNAHDRRISRSRLPAAAVEFAVELMGPDRADIYLSRYYNTKEGR